MTSLERIVALAAFPGTLAGVLGLALAWLGSGRELAPIVGPLVFGSGLLVFALERRFPHHRSWLHSKGDLRTDLAYLVGVGGLVTLFVTPLAATVGFALLAALSERFGAAAWPGQWPLLAQLPLALVVAELPKYWHHRLQHTTDLLWRFHATHHSAPRLYWLNASRFHPIDLFIDTMLGGVTLVAVGAGAELIGLFTIVSGVHGFFQHANVKLSCGPLNYFFSMAELHRWHHSKTLVEANHNYGQNVIVWDWIFGTFFWPRDRQPPEDIGIPDLPAFPMTFWRQLASPFRWRRIRRASEAIARP